VIGEGDAVILKTITPPKIEEFWFSDRIGRERALILTTFWYAGFSLLNALVWNRLGCSSLGYSLELDSQP